VAVPDVVCIAREAGYRTDTIGWHREGQFYAAIHGAHRDGDRDLDLHRERVRWYVYLHLLDSAGFHQRSDVWLAGVTPFLEGELRERAYTRLAREAT
jgi:hypothetical protein